jgi:S-adenosylmethionine hydrolase
MPILTLTTDWGIRDHYVASFKGSLLSLIPALQLIDISHEVNPFDTMQGAFIIRNSFLKFPEGTIHFIGISSDENHSPDQPYVLVKHQGHYLIGEDNGIFTLILGKDEKEIIRLPWLKRLSRTELTTSLQETIRQLVTGVPMDSLGARDNSLKESYFMEPSSDGKSLTGSIIYIDRYGNALVNITRALFTREAKERDFIISLRKASYEITSLSLSYEEVDSGEILALFNQDGYLEIAINKESAEQLLGLRLSDNIRIEFNDRQNS